MSTKTRQKPPTPSVAAGCSVADALRALNSLDEGYRHDGDLMICRSCDRRIVASRFSEKMEHSKTCERYNETNPWRMLADLLTFIVLRGRKPTRKTEAYYVAEDNSDPPQLWVWYGERDESAEPICRLNV